MGKPFGLLPLLDEEGVVPKGSVQGFIQKFGKNHEANPIVQMGRGNDTKFLTINHYAGKVK